MADSPRASGLLAREFLYRITFGNGCNSPRRDARKFLSHLPRNFDGQYTSRAGAHLPCCGKRRQIGSRRGA